MYLRLAVMLPLQHPKGWACRHEPTCSVRNTNFFNINFMSLKRHLCIAYVYTCLRILLWKACSLHSAVRDRNTETEFLKQMKVLNSHSFGSFQPLQHLARCLHFICTLHDQWSTDTFHVWWPYLLAPPFPQPIWSSSPMVQIAGINCFGRKTSGLKFVS